MIKILIVEDERNLADALADFLTTKGHAAAICTESKAVEQAIRDEKPDVLILDYMMPGRRGTDILAALRADEATRRLPVIFVSGTETLRYSAEVPPEPRVRFLRKPVVLESVLTLIHELLNPEGWSA